MTMSIWKIEKVSSCQFSGLSGAGIKAMYASIQQKQATCAPIFVVIKQQMDL